MASQRKAPLQDDPTPETEATRFEDTLPEDAITIDRRSGKDRRKGEGVPEPAKAEKPKLERRAKVARRRQIDPTTCERDYTDEEIEFMNAIDEYKRTSGRMFPTCSEVLEVLRNLGYQKVKMPTEEKQTDTEVDLPAEDTAAATEDAPVVPLAEIGNPLETVEAASASVPCS